MTTSSHKKSINRGAQYAEKASTRLWLEVATGDNPFIATDVYCHGYNHLELMKQRSFVDVLYLLFRGELPGKNEAELLEQLMIALINPGPRHPASRAAINAGVGKTLPEHILPIALNVLGGKYQGAGSVEAAMRFIRGNLDNPVEPVVQQLLEQFQSSVSGDNELAPGFGSYHGSIDVHTHQLAQQLAGLAGAGKSLAWGNLFSQGISPLHQGWLLPGLAAAALCDLGFQPRAGAGLYQLLAAPGLLAHGLEYANKSITALPRVSDDDYYITP